MTNIELPPTADQPDESLPKPVVQPDDIRDALIRLDADETLWREQAEDYRTKSRAELDKIRERLELLRVGSSGSSELNDLSAMYVDLEADFEANKKLDLDTSLGRIAEQAQETIKESGVQRVQPNETPTGDLKDLIEGLEDLGLRIEYVVSAPDIRAPTVILFPQLHYNEGMSPEMMDALGISRSQQDIEDTVTLLNVRDVSGTVFMEGLPYGNFLSETDAEASLNHGVSRAKLTLGDGLDVIGFEDTEFARKGLIENENKLVEALRVTANNIALADNVVRNLTKERDVSMLVIGALHEVVLNGDAYAHPFPLSKVLASQGVNVIVTNVPSQDADAVKQWLEEHPEEMALAASQAKVFATKYMT